MHFENDKSSINDTEWRTTIWKKKEKSIHIYRLGCVPRAISHNAIRKFNDKKKESAICTKLNAA